MNKCGVHTRIPNHSSECGKQKKSDPEQNQAPAPEVGFGINFQLFRLFRKNGPKKTKVLDPEQNEAPASDVGFGNYGRFISSSHINVGRKFLDIVYTRISNPSSGAGA